MKVYFMSYYIRTDMNENKFGVCCFEANNKHEAIGKAYEYYNILFPNSTVEINHNVASVNCRLIDVKKE